MTTETQTVVDEMLEPGLRYTEEVGGMHGSRPQRRCALHLAGEDEPVSELGVISFEKRFGGVSVPAEGLSGVLTLPRFRRQGYMDKLLARAGQSMAERVDVAFVSEAIEVLYEQSGYINCLAEGHFVLNLRYLADMPGIDGVASSRTVRKFTLDDLPALVDLYNAEHVQRPWTHVRHAGWNQLEPEAIWEPGSDVIVLTEGSALAGYAILKGQGFGFVRSPFEVHELAARDGAAARMLLAEAATRCWELRLGEFFLHEPVDSTVGQEARRLGAEYRRTWPAQGGMMGQILHRERLLETLEPELRRRLPCPQMHPDHEQWFNALRCGEIIEDNQDLLRLLLGYWSAADLDRAGVSIPDGTYALLAAWFPGGGTPALLQPYAHRIDRY